ncbi:MAG: MerR family transcriptional regulator [Proteobacteria bacterium]|jgi:DNA-binding transcriptional MerR regulator|nr:MerR family transcriptional regulator [Pseudomonadota bacterium]
MSAIPAGIPAPGGKSAHAFRTISEVACELDVPQHVLRFWETRFAQVKPVKRAGGRRYYRPEDVDLLRGIRSLLYADGFTIKGVQKVLRERGLRHVAEIGRGEAVYAREAAKPLPENAPQVWAEEATHARAIMADLARAHLQDEDAASADARPQLDEEQRTKLEILLAELLQLKGRLRTARAALI